MWVCTDWSINWDAISAVATAIATITALAFGLHAPVARFFDRRSQRRYIATATIHPAQLALNQCRAAAEVLGNIDAHAGTLNDLGAAMRITMHPALDRYAEKMGPFGTTVAAKFCYATTLIEDVNRFADWLATRPPTINPAAMAVVREAAGYAREGAQQAASALQDVVPAIRQHVPPEVLALRFGLPNQA